MKLVRFLYIGSAHWGIIKGKSIKVLKSAPFDSLQLSGNLVSLDKVKLLAPSAPSKIVLAGLNYKDHARELNMKIPDEPVIFLKPPTAIIAREDDIIYPECVSQLDYEAELALVIKKKAKDVSPDKVRDYILGYTCLNDVTARDLQRRDVQWTRAKSFDTFAPCGPWLETEIEPDNLRVTSYLNGKIRQNSLTRNFIFTVYELVSVISKIMTLLPGDIVSTGTPPGIGSMEEGDTIAVEIEGIGRLENKVRRREAYSL